MGLKRTTHSQWTSRSGQHDPIGLAGCWDRSQHCTTRLGKQAMDLKRPCRSLARRGGWISEGREGQEVESVSLHCFRDSLDLEGPSGLGGWWRCSSVGLVLLEYPALRGIQHLLRWLRSTFRELQGSWPGRLSLQSSSACHQLMSTLKDWKWALAARGSLLTFVRYDNSPSCKSGNTGVFACEVMHLRIASKCSRGQV